jgi:hypothetical protein
MFGVESRMTTSHISQIGIVAEITINELTTSPFDDLIMVTPDIT